MRDAMSIVEIAELLDVHRATVYRLIGSGDLIATDVSARGKRPLLKVTRASYEKFLARREIKGRAA